MQCNVWEVGSDDGNGTIDQGSIGVVPDGIESKEANSCRAKQCITFVLCRSVIDFYQISPKKMIYLLITVRNIF